MGKKVKSILPPLNGEVFRTKHDKYLRVLRVLKGRKTPPPAKPRGGYCYYLPEIASAELLFEVCLFSILEKVSACKD
jgi:hypothetical protein